MNKLRKYWLASALAACLVSIPIYAYAVGQVVTGNMTFNASFAETATALSTYSIPLSISSNTAYINGTSSGQVDTVYAKTITLAATTQTIDLTSLVDPAGNSINFARVREFVVANNDPTAGHDLKVEAGASNGWAVLPPLATPAYARYSGSLKYSDPKSTGAGNGNLVSSTSKTITFDSGANTITFSLLIVGSSVL